ncbi:MAG TPA: Rap1a/Tai family immunity protein [Candidatus Polarisedimenticolaceae bacterium]|nr:Rap1a/Tai family immunity protein [Candidatus Polarisedimenticolaceae bacterium]
MKNDLLTCILLCVVSTTPAWPAPANERVDGHALLAVCSNAVRLFDGEPVEAGRESDPPYCLGFVTAVRQAAEQLAERGAAYEQGGVRCSWHYETGWISQIESVAAELFRPVCYPDGLESERLVRLVVQFMRSRPDELHLSGAALVSAAVSQTFPCPSE